MIKERVKFQFFCLANGNVTAFGESRLNQGDEMLQQLWSELNATKEELAREKIKTAHLEILVGFFLIFPNSILDLLYISVNYHHFPTGHTSRGTVAL